MQNQEYIDLLKRVLTSPSGEELLKHWENVYLLANSHVPGDPYSTAFNDGLRSFVIGIKLDLQAQPESEEDEDDLLN